MKIKAVLLFSLFLAGALSAAQLTDVRYHCAPGGCKLGFKFTSGENLPGFFQKFDAKNQILTVAFSETGKSFPSGTFVLAREGAPIRQVKIYEDNKKQKLLKFDFSVNGEINGDKYPAGLAAGNIFEISLPVSKTNPKAWSLSEVIKQTTVSKKDTAKAAEDTATPAAATVKTSAVKEPEAVQEAVAPAPAVVSDSPAVSALIPGIREMNALGGMGISQFRLVMDSAISLDLLKPGKGEFLIALPGPEKSPVFNVSESALVKSLVWTKEGLKIQLQPKAVPFAVISEGALLLQMTEKTPSAKWTYWKALPEGVQKKSWGILPSSKSENFESFMETIGKEGDKKIVSVAESFSLRPTPKELIVVENEAALLAAPEESAPVSLRLAFGDRLVSLELEGLYYRVRTGNKTGYVNRRAVAFRDELSAVQTERLKQLALEKGEMLDSQAVRLETVFDDRITYSSYGRRDPFVEITGLVGEGINVDQVELVGIIWEPEVPMAILVETKNPTISYTVKEGDKILNGKVLKITQTDVLFLIQEFGVNRRFSMGLPDKYGGQ
ncbi:MAG: hypothetical protein LBR60_04930 [Fibrobacter sp.]|jgi:hypothetical protein|nr:hypothetical protein [Fibrobacter sp.]